VLVFTRKRDEAIVIGEGIEVRILRTGRDAVRIGVTAPADVLVHRREVYDAVRDANRTAAAAIPPSVDHLVGRLNMVPALERAD
jgi:carbon storage regulator